MTPDDYVLSVIARYRVQTGPGSAAYQAGQLLYPVIALWAGRYLLEVTYSGSYAKGTAVRGSTDVDLFISVAPDTPGTLKDLYEHLLAFLHAKHLSPGPQNVSIRIPYRGLSVDLVPGRKQRGNTRDHSLYRHRAGCWTKTNVSKHVSFVRNSMRLNEIRALKVWRQLHGLDFPSFYLELAVINALSGRRTHQLAANVLAALQYIEDRLTTARLVDPANSNNIVSDDLNVAEKRRAADQAAASLGKPSWRHIIW